MRILLGDLEGEKLLFALIKPRAESPDSANGERETREAEDGAVVVSRVGA